MTRRVLVCGSRTWPMDDVLVGNILSGLSDVGAIIEGGARGADRLAAMWAVDNGVPLETYLAKWDEFGKRAGFLRNKQMLEKGQPDLVLAFVDKPLEESRGTDMMVDLARKASVPTYVTERMPVNVIHTKGLT